MAEELEDPRRVEPPFVMAERDMLEAWLEFHRMTLLLKCEGVSDAVRKRRPLTTSDLSLHGLVRHMAEVERGWFRRVLMSEPDTPYIFRSAREDDADLVPLDDADWDADLLAWQHECEASRIAAASRELDDVGLRNDLPCSLRWIFVHMIEEYARHNGHADILREMVDGATGW
jgi:uncharacterized damage-inducible protein DinB